MADELRNYVDGEWVDARDGGRFDVVDPATEEVIATAPDSQRADAEAAISAARRAFDAGPWPRSTERERERVLLRAAEIVRREAERLAELETRDSGKPLAEAREDIEEAAFMFEYYGGWATKVMGEIPPVGPDALSLVVKEPVGVAGLITPWNYPLLMAVQKVAPALAAGCTFVLKPAEQTPLTAFELPGILEEAGVPPGVVNVIAGFGPSAGAPLVEHPDVDKVGFTGSVEVGKEIMRTGADTLKRVTLELGGKSPNIIFADASFEEALEGTAAGIFGNQGEICSAGSRIFVERSIYDETLDAMRERARAVRLGSGLDEGTTMGPLVSEEQQERVLSYIESGKAEGAKLATDEPPAFDSGYFVPPTVFYDVTNDMTIAREEIFGPVAAVLPFDDPEEVVRLSNDTTYGLAAAVWTRDITKALRTARALRAGVVWINDSQPAPTEAPWGGYKQSGIGRELGPQGLEDYLETKHIYVNLAE
ncbi:MAG TPA: aldehyde dehydrogenase family protein [Actinomycetota bacterium]